MSVTSIEPDGLLVLNRATISELSVDPGTVLEAVQVRLIQLASGLVHAPQKTGGTPDPAGSRAYAMLAWDLVAGQFGAKLTYNRHPTRPAAGAHYYTLIALFDDRSGKPVAFLDCDMIGAARTAAVSTCFARHCCPSAVRRVAIVGTGVQAKAHCRYFMALLPELELIEFVGTPHAGIEALLSGLTNDRIDVRLAGSPETTVRQADATIAATHGGSATQVRSEWFRPGSLHIQVGSGYDRHVLGCSTYRGALTTSAFPAPPSTEEPDGRARPAADFELADAIIGRKPGFRSSNDIVFAFNSGLAITDLAVASIYVEEAIRQGIGERIHMW